MIACLIIGNVLLVAIASSHPLYGESSAQSMLTEEFNKAFEESGSYPLMIHTTGRVRKTSGWKLTKKMRGIAQDMGATLGLPIKESICYRNLITATAASQTIHDGLFNEVKLTVSSLTGMDEHIKMLSGNLYSDKASDDGYIDAIISQYVMVENDLLVGEELIFESIKGINKKPLKVRISGVFTHSSDDDLFWYRSPSDYKKDIFISPSLFEEIFFDEDNKKNQFDEDWYILPDYEAVTPENVEKLAETTKTLIKDNDQLYSCVTASDFVPLLEKYVIKHKQIEVMLTILEIPVALMLLAFIFMISRQMLSLEEGEVAMLRSRGASSGQIFSLYLLQSLIVSGAAMIIGIPLGALITKLLGRADSFLSFSGGRKMDLVFSASVFIYAAGAALLSVLMTLLPVMRRDKTSIVAVKRKKSRQNKPLWMKLYLDIIITAVSLYGYYSFLNNKDELVTRVLTGKTPDVLLFMSAALFILGTALLCVRLHRGLLKVIYKAGKSKWKPAAYTSLLQLIRSGNKQVFVMVFLILTVSFGLFYTTTSRTIVANSERNTTYMEGADIRLKENFLINYRNVNSGNTKYMYHEPDYAKYGELSGSSARVYISEDSMMLVSNKREPATVFAINTLEFGKTAQLEEGLLPHDYYDYLNVLGSNPEGVLLSMNFKTRFGYKLGDSVEYIVENQGGAKRVKGIVMGFFEKWPTYRAESTQVLSDGTTQTTSSFFIVANLSYIQSEIGVMPYEVWLNLDGNTDEFYEFAEKHSLDLKKVSDRTESIEKLHDDPLFAGTSGILTMSFITILLVCSIGYLMYWSLSIRSRQLQFGIFRAMGVTFKQISAMLSIEQAMTGLYCILAGIVSGHIASILFIPMIQLSYQGADSALEMKLITEPLDVIRLVGVVLIVFFVCMAALMRQVSRMKISQALKLGED